MINIAMPKKVEDGSNGVLGDLGTLQKVAGTALMVVPGMQPAGAAMLGTGALNDFTKTAGSVSQASGLQSANPGAMQRRLQELLSPSQMPMQAQANPPDAFQRRLGMMVG